jgi:ABC-type branched-subunit amino acid transport system ATPase component
MKLLKLYIKNCGIFKNHLIDFTHQESYQDIICLSGVNGSGKTTVMELILNMVNFIHPKLSSQDIFFDRLKPNILTRAEFAQLDLLVDGKTLSLVIGDPSNVIKYEHVDQGIIIENDLKHLILNFENSIVKAPVEEKSIEITFEHLNRLRSGEDLFFKRAIHKSNLDVFPSLLKINKTLSGQNLTDNELPFIYLFNSTDREILDIRYASIPKDKNEYSVAYKYSPKKNDLKKTLIYYDYAYPDKFNEFKDWVNQYVLMGKSIDCIDRSNFQVVIKTKNEGSHNLDLLSTGEQSLLIIASQLYFKASDNAIFLIDEVDQSLHPEFQDKVMKLLFKLQKDKGCQILVSSHSDIIWNKFDNKGLIDLTEMVL